MEGRVLGQPGLQSEKLFQKRRQRWRRRKRRRWWWWKRRRRRGTAINVAVNKAGRKVRSEQKTDGN